MQEKKRKEEKKEVCAIWGSGGGGRRLSRQGPSGYSESAKMEVGRRGEEVWQGGKSQP